MLKRASSSLPCDTNERVCIVVNEAQGVYSLRHSLFTGCVIITAVISD